MGRGTDYLWCRVEILWGEGIEDSRHGRHLVSPLGCEHHSHTQAGQGDAQNVLEFHYDYCLHTNCLHYFFVKRICVGKSLMLYLITNEVDSIATLMLCHTPQRVTQHIVCDLVAGTSMATDSLVCRFQKPVSLQAASLLVNLGLSRGVYNLCNVLLSL